ncbi:hypothetical protein BCCGELA001_31290 [Bradyrhizobium sp. CCGE-LA001]|nr:hypothetical protein BCCGELA001_31290 [Bradyrhizobium sp. CCGE-LA001]
MVGRISDYFQQLLDIRRLTGEGEFRKISAIEFEHSLLADEEMARAMKRQTLCCSAVSVGMSCRLGLVTRLTNPLFVRAVDFCRLHPAMKH